MWLCGGIKILLTIYLLCILNARAGEVIFEQVLSGKKLTELNWITAEEHVDCVKNTNKNQKGW